MTKANKSMTLTALACMLALALFSLAAPQSKSKIGSDIPQIMGVGGSSFSIFIAPGRLSVSRAELNDYVRDAARAVIAYYGHFPVQRTVISFIPSDDEGVGYGSSTYNDDADFGEISINIGANAKKSDLQNSWTLTHEMMHLGFPVVSHQQRWLAEGIATYVEPIGRMRIGNISREEVWGDLLKNLHKGLPARGEGGLQSARHFDRIYWGGALYCLLADVEIRKRTNNQLGLEDALRSIAEHGGTAASDWDAQEAVEAGDRRTGYGIMKKLYEQMNEKPVFIDVVAYLRDLGVVSTGKGVRFDESAPLSSIRRAIDGLD